MTGPVHQKAMMSVASHLIGTAVPCNMDQTIMLLYPEDGTLTARDHPRPNSTRKDPAR
jgi:hypothetical protein